MPKSTGDYTVNYEDDRFKTVESEKADALNDVEETYSGMIDESQSYFDNQSQAVKDWGDTQSKLQQEQTDFAIEQIEQQKQQTEKDYKKEQSGAYVDWQKQSNQYGVNEEAEAMQGMSNTGYSESSQVSMYNTYQARNTAARESYNRAVLNFDNAIKDARLQSNSALAQIAYQTLQTQLELALQGFQYKNQLLLDQANKKLEVDQMYYNRWQDVLAQMNTENSLAEQIRQFNESMALEREQFEWQKEQAAGASGGGSSGGSGSGGGGTKAANTQKSLENMGLGDLSASQAAKLAANGNLSVTTSPVNGEPLYSSVTSKGPNNDSSAYWSSS